MAVKKIIITVFAVWCGILYGFQPAAAAGIAVPAPAQAIEGTAKLSKIRYSRNIEKTRLVLDVSTVPEYTVAVQEDAKRLLVTLKNTETAGTSPVLSLHDDLTKQVIIVPGKEKSVTIAIDLAYLPHYEVFRLSDPQRLVIDLYKIFEQKTEKQLAAGVLYTAMRKGTAAGLLSIHILDYDLKSPQIKLEHVLAKDAIIGRETVTSMAARKNALAAVNGTYFASNGELYGLVIQDGQIVQDPINNRSAFALTYADDILIDQVSFMAELVLPTPAKHRINAVNRTRGQNDLVIYTSVYGGTTRTNNYGMEYVVTDGRISHISPGNTPIPANGFVISGHGLSERALAALKVGDSVTVGEQLKPAWSNIRLAVGAGPQLMKDGAIYLTTKTEGFGSDVSGGRAPRTAVGVNAQGHLLLVVVDGRQPGHSIGMTLIELAKLMQELGAKNAMNLDGGGSTEMVVCGELVNRPSDGRERPVGDALLLVPVEQK